MRSIPPRRGRCSRKRVGATIPETNRSAGLRSLVKSFEAKDDRARSSPRFFDEMSRSTGLRAMCRLCAMPCPPTLQGRSTRASTRCLRKDAPGFLLGCIGNSARHRAWGQLEGSGRGELRGRSRARRAGRRESRRNQNLRARARRRLGIRMFRPSMSSQARRRSQDFPPGDFRCAAKPHPQRRTPTHPWGRNLPP